MADQKISELTALTGANVADDDAIAIVDTSATETKKIVFSELKNALDTATGFVRITGDTMTGDLSMGDNVKAIFGAGSDLQIYHDGSNSYISEGGDGELLLRTNGTGIRLQKNNGENMLKALTDGAVQLYYDNQDKLATTSTGIDVTGANDGETNVAIVNTNAGSSAQVRTKYQTDGGLFTVGKTSNAHAFNGDAYIHNVDDTNIRFATSDTERMRIDSSGNVMIGTTTAGVSGGGEQLTVDNASGNAGISIRSNGTGNGNIYFSDSTTGTGQYAGNLRYDHNTNAMMFNTNSTERMRIDSSGRLLIGNTDGSYASANADNIVIGDRTLSSESGITFGSTVASSLRFADSGTTQRGVIQYVHNDTVNTDYMNFYTAETERMRIDSSGNVGINASTVTAIGSSNRTLQINGTSTSEAGCVRLRSTNGGVDAAFWANSSAAYFGTISNDPLTFRINNSERMRIDSSGNLLVGTTTTPALAGLAVGSTTTGKNISVFASANGTNGLITVYNSAGTQEGQLYAGTGDVNLFGTSVVKVVASSGGVQLTSGATSWTTISDERAKDIIEPITNAAQKVSTLRAVIGRYKTDTEETRRSFLIAQDVQAVLPEAVDATDEDNLGVRYTETIPLLVAAIQEQQATIQTLTARIAALES